MKVFHAARQDVEIVYAETGQSRTRSSTRQVAAMVCGFGESVSYVNLVKKVTGDGPRQVLALHRLEPPAAVATSSSPTRWATSRTCATSTGTSRRELEATGSGRVARRGDGRSRPTPRPTSPPRGGVAAPEAAGQEPQGAGRADGACSLARATGAGAGRAARPHPARRSALRHRQSGADRARTSSPSSAR